MRGRTYDDLRSSFGRNFRRAREALGLSQQGLARQCGVPQPTLSAVECGQLNMSLRSMARLADAVCQQVPDMLRSANDEPA